MSPPIDLAALNALERLRRPLDLYLTPRSMRLFSRWLTAGIGWLDDHTAARREQEFYANAGSV